MNKLGRDFNPSSPTGADFVQHPTVRNFGAEVRDLKARISEFFGTVFSLDTGTLKRDNVGALSPVIPSAALKDLAPNPETKSDEFYTSVTFNTKGLVVAGTVDPVIVAPRHFRALFCGSLDGTKGLAFVETPTGLQTYPPRVDGWRNNYATDLNVKVCNGWGFEWVCPPKVTRARLTLVGASVGGYVFVYESTVPVVPDFGYAVWVGKDGPSYVSSKLDFTREEAALNKVAMISSKGVSSGVYRTQDYVGLQRSRGLYRPYGEPGGPSGMVLIEWYA